jgi:hypothetical protein
MADMELGYPYLEDFPDSAVTLAFDEVGPTRVVVARRVEGAEGLLGGRCEAKVLCSEGDAEVVLDFGEERVGDFHMDFDATSTVEVEVVYGESYEELFADRALELTWYHFPRDRYEIAGPGRKTLHSRGRRAFRYVRILAGKCGGDASISAVSLTRSQYPVEPLGNFTCSDPLLNRIWSVSANTVKLCMQRFYEDGVKRDGLLWVGDARVEALCGHAAFGDTELARRALRMFAATQREDGAIPSCASKAGGHQHTDRIEYMAEVHLGVGQWIIDSYCTDFVSMLKEYHDFSGDDSTLQELWPTTIRTLDYLCTVVPLDPIDPTRIITDENTKVRDSWWASPGVFLMQLLCALNDAVTLAGRLGDEARAAYCRIQADRIKGLLQSKYLLPEEGCYADLPREPGTTPEISWHVNAFAVLAGLPETKGDARVLMERLDPMEDAAYPIAGFMKHWVLQSLLEAGREGKAMDDLRVYWGFMLERDATTFWEKLDLRHPEKILQNPLVSRCHAWTAGPCALLPDHALGVRPASPGYGKVTIAPQTLGLDWAEGTVPTPKGGIRVAWSNTPRFHGSVTLPVGVSGEIILPARDGGTARILPVGPGKTRFGEDDEGESK